MEKNKRIVNFEVLRIVAMLFILLLHTYIDDGIIGSSVDSDEGVIPIFNFIFSMLGNSVFYVAVNCYVLITGYFLINKTEFKVLKIEKIWFHAFFYIFGLTIICFISGIGDITTKDLASSFFVIWGNHNWFVKCYIALIAISPFISKLAQILTKKQYIILLIILTILSTNIIKPLNFPYGDLYDSYGGATLAWFIYLYLVAGYIRLFNPFGGCGVKPVMKWFCLFWLLNMLQLGYKIYSDYNASGELVYSNIGSYNGIVFFMSVFLFLVFRNMTFKSSVWQKIVVVSPYMFGVFLLHIHYKFKYVLWDNINLSDYISSPCFIPYILGVVMLLMFAGIIVELIRINIVKLLNLSFLLDKFNRYVYRNIVK